MQTVHYYGACSNKHRGVLRKRLSAARGGGSAVDDDKCGAGEGAAGPVQQEERPTRKQWAALVKQKFEADPLVCPKCKARMKIVAVIEKASVIDRILKHLGYRFEVAELAERATGPPPPFYWSAEDFSSSGQA